MLPSGGDKGCQLRGASTFSVRDATQTIPPLCPGFSLAARVVGRPADYRRFLSAAVGVGDWCPDRATYFEFYRSVFRRFGSSCGNRNGFGRSLWTSEFRGLSSSFEQDCRRFDTRAHARFLLSHILARGVRVPARCQKFPAEGDVDLAGLCVGDPGTFSVTLGRGLLKRRVIVLGNGAQAARIAKLVETGENEHFIPISFIGTPGEHSSVRSDVLNRSLSDPAALPDGALTEMVYRLGASEIVVATDDRRGLPVRQLLHCKLAGIKVVDFLDFWERETRTVDIEALKPSWLFYSDGFRCGALDELLKRAFDIAVSLGLLLLTLPLLVVTACLIKIESPGPIYHQARVGLHGRVFTILKFRSMRVDAETDGRPRWASEKDPRVTRIGAIIRKLRVDELAQIFNVLRGDMSFVGPRPERPFFVADLAQAIPYYSERHWVRPGITGWAQVNYPYGASTEDAWVKLTYDLYYVKNRSIFLDFVILLQTARVIFWNYGAR